MIDISNTDLMTLSTKKQAIDDQIINGAKFHFSIEQNSERWDEMRRGKVTASQASVLLVNHKTKAGKASAGSVGTLSKGAVSLADKIAMQRYDRLAGINEEKFYGADMQRGHDLEDNAADFAERKLFGNTQLLKCGFIEKDSWCGSSPDRIILQSKEGVEIKCPKAEVQWQYYNNPKILLNTYEAQCQFSMYCSGFDIWHLVSYNPSFENDNLKLVHLIVKRDEDAMCRFYEQMGELEKYVTNKLNKLP